MDKKAASTKITHFPSGFPDEHIASRVTRFHIRSGNLRSKITFEHLFNKSPFSLSTLVQPNLEQLASRLPGDVSENLILIEQKSTLNPLFQQFYVGTEYMPNIKSRTVRRIVGEKGLLKICPECLIADATDHGWPYLHRSHQIPGVTVCWRHARNLLERCPNCSCPYSMSKELVETAWSKCSCGLTTEKLVSMASSDADECEHQLAQFAHELLKAEPIVLNRYQLTELYRRQAHALGINYGAFRINRKILIKKVTAFFGSALLLQIDPAFRKNSSAGWMKIFEERSNTESPLYRHVLLSFFLFRTYASFREKAIAIVQEAEKKIDLSSISDQADTAANKALIQLEQAALRHNSDIAELWTSRTGTMRKLLKLDPSLFKQLEDRLRTMPRRYKKAAPKSNTKFNIAEDDKFWSEAIEKAAKQLYEINDTPVRITKNRIINLVYSRVKKKKILSQAAYPQASNMLETYAEGQWHFYARRITWLLHSLIDTETPNHVIKKLSNWEHHKFHSVFAHLSDCSRGVGASAQTVSAYLSEKKIPKNWEGPEPDRQFDSPGRTYRLRTSRLGTTGELAPRPYSNHGRNVDTPPTPTPVSARR